MGYYTDAVNNLTGAANAAGSAIISAAVAGEHFKNQEKANEMSYVNTKGDLENQYKDKGIELEEAQKGLDALEDDMNINTHDLQEIIERGEQTPEGMVDQALMNDYVAALNARHELETKISAQQLTKEQIERQHNVLKNKIEILDKSNPKLAKKYGGVR